MTQVNTQSGFTLVEILIAMAIFSIISVGTLTALTSAINGKDQAFVKLDQIAQLDVSKALITSDMRDLILRPVRDGFGDRGLTVLSGGAESVLSFTRTGRDNPGGLEPRGDLQRVSYVFESGALIRRALAHENPVSNTPSLDRVLYDGLVDVDIRFLRSGQEDLQIFVPSADAGDILDAIKLELEFASGQRLTQYFEVGL